jgi:hypothetical protein
VTPGRRSGLAIEALIELLDAIGPDPEASVLSRSSLQRTAN